MQIQRQDCLCNIRNGEISLADVKNNQAEFTSNLSEVKKAHKNRTKQQKDTLYHIEIFYKARNEAFKFYDYYYSVMSESKFWATKGTGFEILAPKQLLQRSPIALAQVKAGKTS